MVGQNVAGTDDHGMTKSWDRGGADCLYSFIIRDAKRIHDLNQF
jgi:hypothetical protein